MDAYTVSKFIDDIGSEGSRTEKERLVKLLASSELGNFVLKWAYDPFITFGIKPAKTPGAGKLTFTANLVRPLLERLASRELTGHAAEREIAEVMAALSPDGANLLFLILSKDLKCGIAESTINSAIPGLIPVFAVMRAHAYEEKRVKTFPVYGEPKLDGNRNTFLARDDHGGFYTRSGKIVPALDFLVPAVLRAAQTIVDDPNAPLDLRLLLTNGNEGGALNFMLDGEAMMGLFGETGALRRKSADAAGAELHLYDIMSYGDFDAVGSVGRPLEERRNLLQEFVKRAHAAGVTAIQIVPRYFLNSHQEISDFFTKMRERTLASYLARGDAQREAELLKVTIDAATGHPKVLEGAVIKNPAGLYDKKKSYGWLKMKAEETEDLRVVDAFAGEPHTKYEHCLGGLIVDRNGVRVRVGGGFTDIERHQLWADLHGKPVERAYKDGDGNDQIEIHTPSGGPVTGRLIEVEFHEVTPDGSLRHPRFVKFRDDKDGEIESKEAA